MGIESEFYRAAVDIGNVIKGIGLVIVVIGFLYITLRYAWQQFRRPPEAFQQYRRRLARLTLLGIDIFLVGDILRVFVGFSVDGAVFLLLVVITRVILGWSLEVEATGLWPWQPTPTVTAPGDVLPPNDGEDVTSV